MSEPESPEIRIRKRNTAAAFAFGFLTRAWFTEWFKDNVKSSDVSALTLLLLAIYRYDRASVLLSKQDAAKIIGADHPSTVRRYAKLAEDIGAITIQQSKLDARVDWLVITQQGLGQIERELENIVSELVWVNLRLENNMERADQLRPDLRPLVRVEPGKTLMYGTAIRSLDQAKPHRVSSRRPSQHTSIEDQPAELAMTLEYLRLRPDSPSALYKLSMYEPDPKRALDYINRCIELRPGVSWAYESRARICSLDLGDHERGLADVNYALELDPSKSTALSTRIEIYLALKDYQRALADLNVEINDPPRLMGYPLIKSAATYCQRATALYNLGQIEAALADLVTAHSLIANPDDPSARQIKLDIDSVELEISSRKKIPIAPSRETNHSGPPLQTSSPIRSPDSSTRKASRPAKKR